MNRSGRYHFDEFVFDARRWRLERGGEEVPLQPKVANTLFYCLQRPRRLLAKETLIADLWPGVVVTESVLTRVIRQLRLALGDDARNPRILRTVERAGYEFIADVTASSDDLDQPLTRLAVLPFAPLVSGERDEALELGMAESLITRLSNLRRLVVRPLSAVRRYAPGGNEPIDPVAAGREQQVDIVVEGSLRIREGHLRASIRVLRVADSTALLAESFQGTATQLEVIQESICRDISSRLEIALSQREADSLALRTTDDTRAYRCYLLGRLSSSRHTPADDRHAIEMFGQAVELDPRYALAWGALADCFVQLGTQDPGAGHYETARGHALRGLKLQADLVPALVSLGTIAWLRDRNWTAAERYLRRALASGPGDAGAHIAFSDFCCYQRRYPEAIDAASRALELDPTSAWVNTLLAQALHMSGMHHEALAQARRALEIAPDFAFAHLFSGLACLMTGNHDRSITHLEQARRHSSRDDFAAALALGYGQAGRRDEAQRLIDELESAQGETPPMVLSMACLGVGDEERALDFAERAASTGDWRVLLLHAEPVFQRLNRHPRTAALLSRLRLG